MKDLWNYYQLSIKEFYRVLKDKGVLVCKIQDSISSGKQFLSHIELINQAIKLGFYPKDIFILLSKNVILSPKHNKQQHARKFHSYFVVFNKEDNKVKYSFLA
jgi:ubiquinone/menaquinone biosynthesis C-methylase UbiE